MDEKLISSDIKNVFVVGSWAKAQITIENLKKSKNLKIFAYLKINNPGIASLVDDYKIGNFKKTKKIVEYAKEIEADLVIITTALPLSLGLVNCLKEERISVFGPNKQAAKLESDKAFMRKLMRKYNIDALPEFEVFQNKKKAIEYAEKLDWLIAIKPIGLTEGLGVKVSGNQLEKEEDMVAYINEIFDNEIGGNAKVLIEEKLEGEEFTIQCFVNNDIIIPTPPVQDFKKLYPGDKGLNTASMGSYSFKDYLLPFMKKRNYEDALKIIDKTVKSFIKETGQDCCGFLYGQFMLTDAGIKLIEFNFRPGDPEWMNTLCVLKESIIDVIINLLNKKEKKLHFEPMATVCKYIVPEKYPKELDQVLDLFFPEEKIKNLGVNFYYSCGEDTNGKLNVGSERGIAFISKDENIFKANCKVEKAISLVKGDFFHRKDIGTRKMIELKKMKIGSKIN